MQPPAIYIKTYFSSAPAASGLSTQDLRMLWDKLHAQNLLRVLVITNTVTGFNDFLHMLTHGEKYVSAVFSAKTNDCLGFAWLDKISESMALMHFTPFKEAVENIYPIGYACMEEIFLRGNPAGVGLVYAHIPVRYPAVQRFAECMGLVDTGKLRDYVRIRPDGTERRFPAKVYATHVTHLRKHLAKIPPESRAVVVPPPAARAPACLAFLLALIFVLCAALAAPSPSFAATPLAQLEKKLGQEKKKADERKKSLSRLTDQERQLNAELAAAEKRILELEQGIARHQQKLLEIGTADDKERRQYEALLAEQAKTEKAQAETLRLLWELTGKRLAVGNRDLADWADTDREYAWSKELYVALEGYRKELDARETKLVEVLGRRDKLSRDMQLRLKSVNNEKAQLLKKRLEYDKKLAEVRKKRDSDEAELARILKLVENLNFEITQRSAGDIAAMKGRLKPPVTGKTRVRYRPQASPPSRGLGYATADTAQVRAVASGRVVHNDVLRGFGTVLIVQHGEDYYTLYAFLGSSPLKVGQDVETGQSIGYTGYYPTIKGPGLYFELRFKQKAINPEPWFAS